VTNLLSNRVMTRRSILKTGGACLATTLAPGFTRGQSSDDDALQRWIERNAVSVNSERLVSAIGDARIVMLGEPSHGAGTAFAARVRLVQLLHERLGFDVLMWESGLIDLERTEAALRGDGDPVEAAQRGIFKIWSASAECRPLFAWAQASHSGSRPLTMAGFDMQITAPGTLDYFGAELRAFIGTLDPMTQREAAPLAENVLNHFGRLFRYTDALATKAVELGDKTAHAALRPVAADLDRLEEAADALKRLLGGRAGFMSRALASLTGYGANLLEAEDPARYALSMENRRDRINADNLKWLIDTAYAGRKIIVWAHNAHVMNAGYGPGFDSVSLEPLTKGMKTTAVWLTGWYGATLYKIGFTAFQGSDGLVGSPPTPFPPAPVGSLEERLHRLGAPEVFLPLPAASVSMRIPKYKVETVAKPATAFDAIYFIDTMKPATLIPPG
jgi:erythromycin esterase